MTKKTQVRYSKKLCDEILLLIEQKKTLTYICKLEGMPSMRSIYGWRHKYPDFNERFKVSEEIRVSCLVDEMLDMTEEGKSAYDRLVKKLGCEPSKGQLYSEEARIKERNGNTKFFVARLSGVRNDRKSDNQDSTPIVIKSYTRDGAENSSEKINQDLQPSHLKNYDSYSEQDRSKMEQLKANK